MFIAMCSRKAPKPLCMLAHRQRASARSATSRGQSASSGKRSAKYSPMASESQMRRSPSSSTGTFATGERGDNCAANSGVSSQCWRSSKGMPKAVIATQERMDQDE